ncbi:putative Ig domain-containing protein [Staphylococcus delphini]|uniref:lectin-like domain-containing protein n=1 Tax=Staphylococcus delphini TaxID=53344 RepID=UPI00374F2233
MSKKEKVLNECLKQEKSRVKLYKSGKHWVKSGMKEVKFLHMMGFPLLTSASSDEGDEDERHTNTIKRSVIKVSTLAGGAVTANLFQGHEAMAASELPLTSEWSTQSEAVANQNSTALRPPSISESEMLSAEALQSSESNDAKAHIQTSESNHASSAESQNLKDTTQPSESHHESVQIKTSESVHAEESTQASENHRMPMTESEHPEETAQSSESYSEKQIHQSESVENHTSPPVQTTTRFETYDYTSTTTHDTTTNQQSEAKVKEKTHSTAATSDDTPTTNPSDHTKKIRKARSVSHVTENHTTTRATTTAVTDQVIVTRENFERHFSTHGTAYYTPESGIVTLTSDANNQKGSVTLGSKVNFNQDFELTLGVGLGTRYEGHSPDGVIGGDGIGFVFSPGPLDQSGRQGAAVGFGGLQDAFGFKLDTYHNTRQPKANDYANADPPSVGGGGAFGAFVSTNNKGVAVTYTDYSTSATAAKLEKQPDGTIQDLLIQYDAKTRVMTVVYAGQRWTKNISDWILRGRTTNYAFGITASTGGARNLQQIQVGSFYYTEAAVTHISYFDADIGKEIIPPKTVAGSVGDVVTVDKQESDLSTKGYRFVGYYSKEAPTYNVSNNTVNLTEKGQNIVFFYKDVEAPTLTMPTQTKELNVPFRPITVNTTDNSGGHVRNTVTGLPDGLLYDEIENVITGKATKLGDYKVTVTSVDEADNVSTSSFDFKIVDTIPPVVKVNHQYNTVFQEIKEITIETRDNSGHTIDTVTGLPRGLWYNPQTKTVSGRPTQIGAFLVTVTSQDASHNKTNKNFVWTIERNAHSDSISLSHSTSVINSIKASQSMSESTQTSLSTSESISMVDSTSASLSMSQSMRTSMLASESLSNSTSVSASDSASLSGSASESTSFSGSISDSLSVLDSTSSSNSLSESASMKDSASLSNSHSASMSQSLASSESMSASISNSNRLSLSESVSASMSNQTSDSMRLSESNSTSTSLSLSTSESDSMRDSTSISNSDSTSLSGSASQSVSTLESMSTSASQSGSHSTSNSLSTSESTSLSDSVYASNSELKSNSTSLSLSTSGSASISNSLSHFGSDSISASVSASNSTSVSTSLSTSVSMADSTSVSTSLSDSVSMSNSASTSSSTSTSESFSDSRSMSQSTSLSTDTSISDSHSVSTSASASLGTSNSTSTSLSLSDAQSTSHSVSESESMQHHSTSESTSSLPSTTESHSMSHHTSASSSESHSHNRISSHHESLSSSENASQSMQPTTSEAIKQQPSHTSADHASVTLPNTGSEEASSKGLWAGLLSVILGIALFGKAKKDKNDKKDN